MLPLQSPNNMLAKTCSRLRFRPFDSREIRGLLVWQPFPAFRFVRLALFEHRTRLFRIEFFALMFVSAIRLTRCPLFVT